MIHDSRIDWPPPWGAPVTMCCFMDVESYDPVENDWDGFYGADVTIGVTWWDTWEEAITYWRDGIQHTYYMARSAAEGADMLIHDIDAIDRLAAKYT